MKQSLSVVLSVHNEETNIREALESVKNLANEIIIVDNESTDKTVQIAKKYTKNILDHKNTPNSLNTPKNYGFSKATGDWILSLDADERVSPELAKEINSVISVPGSLRNGHTLTEVSQTSVNGYWMPRQNLVFGKWLEHGIWYPDYQLRLFRKEKGRFPAIHNHEFLAVEGKTEKLKGHLIHKSYSGITEYIDKFNHTYTDNEAENFLKSGKKIIWIDAVRWPLSDFLTNFFARQSYKDGLHGLVLSLLQAFYALEVFSKIWERQVFWEYNSKDLAKDVKAEFQAKSKEFSWWYTKELIPWFLKPKQVIKKILT
ncbi:MAG: Glycosyltransferase [candidate division CPR1 bacterium GW2011_GWA2_42_17]|uniref:Glycosyltransferase n=1 Tax=candidate division CPR1 bacterium GW2011_GWA2_42_17 TaxID=1618341 RepID=A0A0G0YWX9_9BACT|nr:MAG: Glycosyltransferase [candidate division CPR1 bacterium GW2011_GWA2_42_17]